ncbi:protealysin inhibitor emfourin [Streptomyces sp. TS71-3]|uniref:protealysin inhibitor emfourin n=1 Tax=Streptomyces sp. TS71-3 TaxID=2733862 RepID=UPI001B22553B|nr:protealysin inhibitor emfourin [Streptomyces sp. TS71-3]GHJ37704.1 hypothetical protein Sm713_33130 [Streptomyces sp. TS71-3]
MRIQVKRTGGFAGVERHAAVDVSARDDAEEWQALADQVLSEGRGTPPLGVPDGFQYQITVGQKTVYCADPRLTEAQRKLITRVLKEGA